MLLQFNVSNFLSFRDEAVLSLCANGLNDHEEILLTNGNDRILPMVSVFGANASGKSSLHKALTAGILIVRNSIKLQVNEPIINIVPFKFNKTNINKPSSFCFIFTKNGIKYEYGFTADITKIHSEYLYVYKTQKPTRIFERKETTNFEFNESNKAELSKIASFTNANKLFLSVATSLNCELTKEAYLWFVEDIDTYDSKMLEDGLPQYLDYNQDTELSNYLSNFMAIADINISGYTFESSEIPPQSRELFKKMLKVDEEKLNGLKEYKITTHHRFNTENGIEEYNLRLGEESNGTKKLFAYGPIVKKALNLGKTIVVDEIDNCLHPLLVQFLVEQFNNPKINKNKAQLIFNTHDVNLLDLQKVRRDQIYFVNKNYCDGVSELYSLDEFSVRKDEKIQKNYLEGRFGAIPNIDL